MLNHREGSRSVTRNVVSLELAPCHIIYFTCWNNLMKLISSIRHKILAENVSDTERKIQETRKSLEDAKEIVSSSVFRNFKFSYRFQSYDCNKIKVL